MANINSLNTHGFRKRLLHNATHNIIWCWRQPADNDCSFGIQCDCNFFLICFVLLPLLQFEEGQFASAVTSHFLYISSSSLLVLNVFLCITIFSRHFFTLNRYSCSNNFSARSFYRLLFKTVTISLYCPSFRIRVILILLKLKFDNVYMQNT